MAIGLKDSNIISKKLIFIDNFLKDNQLNITLITKCSYARLNELINSNNRLLKYYLKKVAKYFKFDVSMLLDDNKDIKTIELNIDPKLRKVRELNTYLFSNYELQLYRALSYRQSKLESILRGERKVPKKLLSKLSTYFSLPIHLFLNDKESLPLDKIILDDNLVSIQKQDLSNEIKREKNKNSFKKHWNILSHKQRVKLIFTSLLLVIPLSLYTSYCAYTLITDRVETTSTFLKEQSLTSEESKIYQLQDQLLKERNKEKYQVEVSIGMNVANIKNVSNSGMSFSPSVEIFFDFDNEDYFRMIYNHENNQDFDKRSEYLNDPIYRRDDFGYNMTSGEFFKHADNVPDYMQLEGYAIEDSSNPFYTTSYKDFVDKLYTETGSDGKKYMSDETWSKVDIKNIEMAQIYSKVISQYPGEASSNVYPNKEDIFSVGNYLGGFNADEFSYGFSTPYMLTDDEGNVSYRYFQSLSFSGTISKIYKSPRYPLDSVSFTIPITSKKLSYEYLKYKPVDYVDLTASQIIRNQDPNNNGKKYTCSIDSNIYSSGTNPGFKISTGYKLFNSGDIKDISKKVILRYFVDSHNGKDNVSSQINDPSKVFYFSEFQFIMHANRGGISLFLQAFINLFAVVIWIVIAFYDQTYHNESAIGMLGTGLFGAISSILVGLSMISEAGMFSLITMINIFTLAVILIMTVSSISAKRAKIIDDQVAISYNSAILRILFITLTICTLIMFIGLPLVSYIFY